MAKQKITLEPGQSKVVTFEFIPKERKTYQVTVDGLTGSFEAIEVDIRVESFGIYPERPPLVSVGEPVEILVTVKNYSNAYGEKDIYCEVTGFSPMSQVVALNPGEQTQISFSVTPASPGVYNISVDGLTDSFEVFPITHWIYAGFYDEAVPEWLPGTIIVDGVEHRIVLPSYTWMGELDEGSHVFDAIVPPGYRFSKARVSDAKTENLLFWVDKFPASILVDRDIAIQVVLEPVLYSVGIGIYDEAVPQYVAGTIFIDEAKHPVEAGRYLTLSLEPGTHTFNLVVPSGYEFVKWKVYDWATEGIILETSSRPAELVISTNTFIYAIVSIVPVIEIALHKGYNRVTYTGRVQSAADAFASIADYVAMVYHFVDSEYYEPINWRSTTDMMIPGDDYWVAVTQDCIWTF